MSEFNCVKWEGPYKNMVPPAVVSDVRCLVQLGGRATPSTPLYVTLQRKYESTVPNIEHHLLLTRRATIKVVPPVWSQLKIQNKINK